MNLKLLFFTTIACLLLYIPAQCQVFFDDFKSSYIDSAVWYKHDTKWGENPKKGTHGGVVPANLYARKGNLIVRALGDNYKGYIQGHGQNTKVGGAMRTVKMYASGSYEVRAKICPQVGALSAFWSFYYENDNYNHEIDFEFPGHNQPPNNPDSTNLNWGLMTNWTGVAETQYKTTDAYFGNQTDGQYHLYRYEWHTGGNGQTPRVEYYYDNKLLHTAYEHVPFHAANFTVGIWFPNWIGKANFDTDYMYIDWVKITPFNEPNDVK